MLANQLDNHTSLQILEDCYTINPKADNFVSNVNFWHPTKNNKRGNNYKNDIVRCTSIDNSFQIQKNWHLWPIFDNTHMNRNPRLVVQSGDLIIIDWNESSLLDQQHNMFQNNIMNGNSHTPTNWICPMFPKCMMYFQNLSYAQNQSWVYHVFTIFDNFFSIFFLPFIDHQICNKV